MSQPTRPTLVMLDFSGGLNSAEPADQIGANQLADLRNLEFRRGKSLKRRRGSTDPLTNNTIFAASSSVVTLFRHTPGASENAMELWGMSNDTTPELGRVAAGSAWAAVSLSDAISSAADAWFLRGVSFNGKLYLPYNSATDRLHFWDGSTVQRVGLDTPGTPTVANTGAGAYAAISRYYKVQWLRVYATGRVAYGPLSAASTVFTPSGAGTAARVTRPSLPSEGETNWFVWGSADGVNYYVIAGVASGTSTYDDSAAPSSYATAQPTYTGFPTGSDYFTPPISVKFLLADGAQLLMAGSHETAGLTSTVYYTDALKTTGFDVEDDERVPSTNRIDVDPQHGGGITGLGGPIGGTPIVFKIGRTYALNPTNDPTLPYTHQLLSSVVGCVSYQGIVMAEDENGNPALYFPSRRGYYRYGSQGLEYCGKDIEDLWATVNLSATYGITADYHADAGQIWVFLPTGSDTTPSVLVKFHVELGQRDGLGRVRGGWTRDNGNLAGSSAVCLFSETPAATMSLRLKPYTAKVAAGGVVYKSDYDSTNRDDNDSATYTAYMTTRAVRGEVGQQFGVQDVYTQGIGDSSVDLTVTLVRNFNSLDVANGTATFGTTRTGTTVSGLELSECEVVQVTVSDGGGGGGGVNQHWSLDHVGLRYRQEAPKKA